MGVLESVLNYKRQKEADAQADIQAIPQGINAFITAKQNAQKNLLDEMTLKVSAAKSGFDIDTRTGAIKQNPDYMNNLGGNILQVSQSGEVENLGTFGKRDKVVRKALTPEELGDRTQAQRDVITENPNLDTDTQRAIAAKEYIEPKLTRINELLDSDVLGKDGFDRLAKQVTVSKSGDLLVPDGHPMEELIGLINDIKLTGFSLGGATFTETEAKKIEGGLDPVGKSYKRYRQDLQRLPDFFAKKAQAGVMGLKEAREKAYTTNQNQQTQEKKPKLTPEQARELLKKMGK